MHTQSEFRNIYHFSYYLSNMAVNSQFKHSYRTIYKECVLRHPLKNEISGHRKVAHIYHYIRFVQKKEANEKGTEYKGSRKQPSTTTIHMC